jgi:antitoxin component of RelBE/YafQ-DinJ toxin-antitoxin module
METTNLQIPIRMTLKKSATEAALAQGFSSLQEAVRVFLKKLSEGSMNVSYIEKTIQLSTKAIRRYNRMSKEIESRKGWHEAKDVDDLMKQLNA